MKKMIIALDGEHFPHGAFEFAKYINRQVEIMLAGVFLSPVDYAKLLAYSGVEGIALMPESLMRNDDDDGVNANIKLFEKGCIDEGMQYKVHKDNAGMALSSLIEETRFADLLLVSSELFYENVQKIQPNFYLEEVLIKAECPVLLVPEHFVEPTQNVLAYDGSESAAFAIKQFAYLFPELSDIETVLLCIGNKNKEQEEVPDYSMITELVSQHYPLLRIQNLTLADKKDFTMWMEEQPQSIVVIGAYSRSLISELFKKSFAATLIRNLKMPLFISHK